MIIAVVGAFCGWGSRGDARQQRHDGNTSNYSFGDSDGAE
jgi:hypothetical protein